MFVSSMRDTKTLPFDFDGIRSDLNRAFKEIGEKHGIAIQIGGIKYNQNGFHSKLEAFKTKEGAGGAVDPMRLKAESEFSKKRWYLNMRADALGKDISVWGKEYTVYGWTGRSLLLESKQDGKVYRFIHDRVRSQIPETLKEEFKGSLTKVDMPK